MKLKIKKEVNLTPADIENLKPTFTLLHGRRFTYQPVDGNGFKNISLNSLILAVKNEALKPEQDKNEIRNFLRVFKVIKDLGYKTPNCQINQENFLTRIITKIKHFFSKWRRKTLFKELNQTIIGDNLKVIPSKIKKKDNTPSNPKPPDLIENAIAAPPPVVQPIEANPRAEEKKEVDKEFKVFATPQLLKIPQPIPTEEEFISKSWKELENKTKQFLPNYDYQEATVAGKYPFIFFGKNTEWILANYVGEGVSSRKFIASQLPDYDAQPNFWKIVFEECDVIIDLTTEGEKRSRGIYYAPQDRVAKDIKYDKITVNLIDNQQIEPGKNIFKYELKKDDSDLVKEVKRLHYGLWPDGKFISVSELSSFVDLLNNELKDKKVLIHCKAGVGRTGTLITAAILKEKIDAKEINAENFETEIPKIILALRRQRRKDFVNSLEQFWLLHAYVRSLLGLESEFNLKKSLQEDLDLIYTDLGFPINHDIEESKKMKPSGLFHLNI